MKSWKSIAVLFAVIITAVLFTTIVIPGAVASSDGSAMDSLGFDTNALPEGYEAPGGIEDTPYGKENVIVAPVSELFTVDGFRNGGILEGHNGETLNTNLGPEFPGKFYSTTRSAAGDFDGDGREESVAMVGLNPGVSSSFDLVITDPLTGTTTYHPLGNGLCGMGIPGYDLTNYQISGYAYKLQNYLSIAAGDYDGDGTDEIAVLVPVLPAHIDIWDNGSGTWEKTNHFNLMGIPDMVDILSADINADGIDDLCFSQNQYNRTLEDWYEPKENFSISDSYIHVCYGSAENPLKIDEEMVCKRSDDDTAMITRLALDFGDVDHDGKSELIAAGQNERDENTRWFALYEYDHDANCLEMINDTLITIGEYDLEWGDNTYNYPYLSTAGCIANMACLKMVGGKEYIYCDSILYEYTPGGFAMNKRFEGTSFTAGDISDGGGAWWGAAGVKYTDLESDGGNYYFHEWGAIAADFDGDGVETIYTEQYFWKDVYVDRLSSIHNEKNGDSLVLDFPIYRQTQINPLDVESGTNITEGDNSFTWCYPEIGGDYLGFQYNNFNFTAPNTDNDSMVLQYKDYHFTYSSPIVMAVLASPPYFSDLEHMDGGDTYVYNSETSFGKTEGTGTSTTESYAVTLGGMVGFEHNFAIFGVDVASVDIEAEYQHDWTWETEEAESVEYSLTYTTFGGQDSVVLYSIPTDVFTYDAWTPNEDGSEWEWSEMVVQIPYQPVTSVVERSFYDNIAVQYPDTLTIIGGNILEHTIGQPGTYPGSTVGLSDVLTGSEWSGVSGGAGAAITQGIDITTENTDSTGYNNAWNLTVGGSILDVKASVSAGGEAGGGEAVTETNGTTFETTVVNMPLEGQDAGYRYSWKLLKYSYDGVQNFPVVTYLVTDVTQPPTIPASICANGISTSEIQLNWEESKNLDGTIDDTVDSYSIYRYFDTSISPGYRLIAEIPSFSSGEYSYDEETGLYTANNGGHVFSYDEENSTYGYINSGLSAYTLYEYKIQVTREIPVHLESVLSEACEGRTYSNIGSITITGPENTEIFPDEEMVELSVDVDVDLQEGSTAGETLYQWQQRNLAYRDQEGNWIIPDENDWNDISNETSADLIIDDLAASASLEYRCVVDVEVSPSGGGSQWIGAISDAAVLTLSKRTLIMQITVNNAGADSLEISLEAMVDKDTGIADPTGIVAFTLTNDTSYSKTVTADVDADSTATVNDLILPAEGIYCVTAVYGGDIVYQSISAEEEFVAVSSGSSEFYWIEADSSLKYGSTLNPTVWKYVQDSDPVEIIGAVFLVEDNNDWVSDNTVTAKAVGSYTLTADFTVEGAEKTVTKGLTVIPKPITVTAPNDSAEQGEASLPAPDTLVFDPAPVFEDDADSLGLSVQCVDSQGNPVTMDAATAAGVYNTCVKADSGFAEAQRNYDFEFINGFYTVVGQRFAVTVNSTGNGNVTITNPEDPYETIEGVDKYVDGTSITVTAAPSNGYSVTRWEANDVITDPNNLADSNVFTWPVAGTNLSITAIFSVKENYLTLEAEHGCINNNTYIESGDAIAADAVIEFTAAADAGWHFKEWVQTVSGSDTILDGNPLVFTMPDSSCTLTAVFERDSYIITLGEQLTAQSGGEDIASGDQAAGDSEVSVYAKPGYTINKWFMDGVEDTSIPVQEVYNFNIVKDTEITAETERQTFMVVYDTDDGGGTIIATADGIEFTSGDPVGGGAEIIITVIPDEYYTFDNWAIQGTASHDCTTDGTTLTCVALSGDLTVTASLVPPNTVSVSSGVHGSVTAEINGEPAEVAADGLLFVPYGASLTLTAHPEDGFMVESWSTNDEPYYSTAKTWSIASVTADTAIHADFTSIAFYSVTYSVDAESAANGSLTAEADGIAFASGDEIGGGSELQFTAEPAESYMVSGWTVMVRGEEQSEYSEYKGSVLVIPGLSGDMDVQVSFEQLETYEVNGLVHGDGGQITSLLYEPDLIDGKMRPGGSVTFMITEDEDYCLETVVRMDDDGEADVTDQVDSSGIYVLDNVTSDTWVIVTFSYSGGGGGGGGFGGGPRPIVHTVPASSDSTAVKVPYTLKDETATLKLDGDIMEELLEKSFETGIIIDMTGVDDCNCIEFELDGKWLTENEKILSLTVTGIGEVTINRNMLKNFGVKNSSTIHVTIKLGSIKISLELDDKVITDHDILNPVRVLYPYDNRMSIVTIIYDTKTNRVLPFSLSDGEGNMKFLTSYFSTFEAKDNPKTFNDIGGHWAADYIDFTTARELFLGTGVAEFSPDISMTRAMFVTVLGRMLGVAESDYSGTSFSDVNTGQWYSSYVQWAAANHIVEGYGGGLFGPDDSITREQMAAIILRFADYANIELKVSSDAIIFADNASISPWALDYVSAAQQSGLIQGREGNLFDPKSASTRAEVATILQRFIENVLQ